MYNFERFGKIRMKNALKIIGLMSGTSLDGLDVAACEFDFSQGKWNYQIHAAETFSYSDFWKQRLQTLDKQDAQTFVQTDTEYGRLLGETVKDFLKKYNFSADYIASHGHTIFHQPHAGFTSQIGNGAVLAAVSGVNVVCDFRSTDVALSGQGAPLVPVGDALLFYDYDYCLNIGGFSNISFAKNGVRKAFDISPANIALNYFANKENCLFDKNGQLARQGKLQNDLFNALNTIDFYQNHHAKSLGKEWFETLFLPIIFSFDCTNKDILATLTEHIAFQVSRSIKETENKKMLMTGGGVKNTFLIEKIIHYLPDLECVIPDELLIDYKEALIFAFLGCLRIDNKMNCLQTVTGGTRDHIAGAIYLA